MTAIPESHRDLIDSPWTASLSTLGADGTPQVTALWYLADGDVIQTSLMKSRQKYRNLLAHPKATLFILDPSNSFRSLEVRADAFVTDDENLTFFNRILQHYGHDPETFTANRTDRVVLTLKPFRIVALG